MIRQLALREILEFILPSTLGHRNLGFIVRYSAKLPRADVISTAFVPLVLQLRDLRKHLMSFIYQELQG